MKAILFDLDGTLLASDVEEQIRIYLARITLYTRERLPQLSGTLPQDILRAVQTTVTDLDAERTVADKFWDAYCGMTGAVRQETEPVFNTFYETVYNEVGAGYRPVPEMRQAVALCRRRGMKLCVATNCFYPLSAVKWRIRWAGLDPDAFDLITHYDNMHFTKPALQYFSEAAGHLGVSAEECAMVGNDGGDDMVAGRLGMRTFLLTEFLLHEDGYNGDRGGYQALLDWLEAL